MTDGNPHCPSHSFRTCNIDGNPDIPSTSHDFECLLELDHELPVVLLEVVAEVVLAGVDGGPVDLAHQMVLKQSVKYS